MEYPNVTVSKPPVVQDELQRLEKSQAELLEVISALEGRLMVAMREPEPTPTPTTAESPKILQSQSQLVSMIRGRVNDTESAISRLSAILRRLEV